MSFAELKRKVPHLTQRQRHELAVMLSRLADSEGEDWLAQELSRRNAAMDAGRKHSLDDLRRVHEMLIEQGR